MKNCWREAYGAFNDTLVDLPSASPKRLLVSYQIPLIDVDYAVSEVERLTRQGARSVQLPAFPPTWACPTIMIGATIRFGRCCRKPAYRISHHLEVK